MPGNRIIVDVVGGFGRAGAAGGAALAKAAGAPDIIPPAPPAKILARAGNIIGKAVGLPDWCADDALAQVDALIAALPAPTPDPWQTALGWLPKVKGVYSIPAWFAAIDAVTPDMLSIPLSHTLRAPFWVLDWAAGVVGVNRVCSVNKAFPLLTMKFLFGVSNVATFGGLERVVESISRCINYMCPSIPPSPEEALEGWVRGQINPVDLDKWGKVGGVCPPTMLLRRKLRQYWPDIEKLFHFFYWGKIKTRADLETRLENVGVKDSQIKADLIDTHWTPWGLEHIFEALHRLRPDRVPPNLAYGVLDAKRDLLRLGYEPAQHDRMIALSYATVTHRRLLQPYKEGLLSWKTFTDYMRDDRTTEEAINALKPFFDFERKLTLREQTGAPAPAALAKLLADGVITTAEYDAEMSARGYQAQTIAAGEQEAALMLARQLKEACISQAEGQLKSGASDLTQVAVELAQCGVSPQRAAELAQLWALRRATGSRPVSAADLCTWVSNGWMTVAEYGKRLVQIGYASADVKRIVDTCGLKVRAAQERKQAAAVKRTAAEIKARILAARTADKERAKVIADDQKAAKAKIGQAKTTASSVKSHVKQDQKTDAPITPAQAVTPPIDQTATSVVSGATSPQVGTPTAPYTTPPYAAQYLPGSALAQPQNPSGQGTIPPDTLPPP